MKSSSESLSVILLEMPSGSDDFVDVYHMHRLCPQAGRRMKASALVSAERGAGAYEKHRHQELRRNIEFNQCILIKDNLERKSPESPVIEGFLHGGLCFGGML
jgi:hypothetical protein